LGCGFPVPNNAGRKSTDQRKPSGRAVARHLSLQLKTLNQRCPGDRTDNPSRIGYYSWDFIAAFFAEIKS